jgi:hypothetical protein
MNAKELSERLTGCEYLKEVSKELEALAKESGLVIVFGASDDLMEFRGAIYDEIDAYNGTTVYLNSNGLLEDECGRFDSECPYFERLKASAKTIKAIWGNNEPWKYETDISHETFEVLEDGETYCRGIVFSLDDVK